MAENKIVLQDLFKPENVQSELGEYWVTIISKRWLILGMTAFVMFASALHFARIPDQYTTSTDILVEPPPELPKTTQGEMATTVGGDTQGEEYYGTQIEIMTGPTIGDIVDKELGPLPGGYTVSAQHKRDTRIIELTCNSTDPKSAALAANKYAEVYIRESGKESTYVTQQMLKWIPEDLETLENKDEMAKLTTKLNKKEFAESLANVTQDAVIQKMRADKLDTESKLQEYSRRYRPQHPMMVELRERLTYIERQLKDRTKVILDNLRAKLAGDVSVTNVRILRKAEVPGAPSGPNRMRGILMSTLAGLLVSVWLVVMLEEINQKIRTEKDLVHTGDLPFLGYIPLAKELLKNKKGVTRVLAPGETPSVIDAMRHNSVLADAVASVRTRILFSVPYEKSKRIMITSTIPDEGKSTVAALLAYSLTGLGRKILLIDADMRKPFVHTTFNIRNEKGLTDFLVGQANYEDIIKSIDGGSLKVVTGGSTTSNPSEILSSDRLRELLERAQTEFDRVVIDVPPVLFIPDGLVVAKHVNMGVLVCGSGMAHKKTVRETKEKFDAIGHSFIGAVINRADYENEGYRYKYFNTYKKYYKRRTEPLQQAQ